MAHRGGGGSRSAYYFFVRDRLPELQRRGLPLARVVDAIPYCSEEWALLTEEEKMKYTEMARKWKENKLPQKPVREVPNLAHPVPACLTTKTPRSASLPDASAVSWKNDQAVVADIIYFLNIYSHGELLSHCEQRFLPCEIGCVKYSLKEGIMADFHHFIDPEVPPRGFRYHCQAASDNTHKIPISGFELSRARYPVVLRELLAFVQPSGDVWPRFYCRCNDRYRISWCLRRMASVSGIESRLELLNVEDLIVELYWKKYQKEPSRTWVCKELDVFLWDYSSNTRCKWHEENDILFCALASCKKIAYCISKSLASVYGVSLTAAHLPLEDCGSPDSTNAKIVVLDAGRFQNMKAKSSGHDSHFISPSQDQGFIPSACESETFTFGKGKRVFKLYLMIVLLLFQISELTCPLLLPESLSGSV
ncbi:protein maelstrom homolog isoform X1 [Struthio camelus]|uniref:protein maelstrom homolog isoform X1 n=1 Tax=Struthio camelus TaxID=8801 RepID=UPI003603D70A